MTRSLLLLWQSCCFASLLAQTPVRAKVFPGAQALPMMAGVQQSIFERHGIKLELLFTTTSQEQRDGLAYGRLPGGARRGRQRGGDGRDAPKHDVIIVSGGDSSMNEFFVQAESARSPTSRAAP